MQQAQRSRLMRLSWQIQKIRKSNRSKSLFAAWSIFLNEDITVLHLIRKHSKAKAIKPQAASNLTLFNF